MRNFFPLESTHGQTLALEPYTSLASKCVCRRNCRFSSDAVYFKSLQRCVFCLLRHVSKPTQRASSVPATWYSSWQCLRWARPCCSLCDLSWLHLPRYCLFLSIHHCPMHSRTVNPRDRCSRTLVCTNKVEDLHPPAVVSVETLRTLIWCRRQHIYSFSS